MAIRTDAGIEVRDGQRRTLAARHAKLASIPVCEAANGYPLSDIERVLTGERGANEVYQESAHAS